MTVIALASYQLPLLFPLAYQVSELRKASWSEFEYIDDPLKKFKPLYVSSKSRGEGKVEGRLTYNVREDSSFIRSTDLDNLLLHEL